MNVGDKAMYIERKDKLLWLKENFLPSGRGSFTGVLMECLPPPCFSIQHILLRGHILGTVFSCPRACHSVSSPGLEVKSQPCFDCMGSASPEWEEFPGMLNNTGPSIVIDWFVPALAESWDCKADSHSSSSSWNSLGGKQKDFKERSLINSTLNTLLVWCVWWCSSSGDLFKVSKREADLRPSSGKSEELARQILLEGEVFGRGGGMGRL